MALFASTVPGSIVRKIFHCSKGHRSTTCGQRKPFGLRRFLGQVASDTLSRDMSILQSGESTFRFLLRTLCAHFAPCCGRCARFALPLTLLTRRVEMPPRDPAKPFFVQNCIAFPTESRLVFLSAACFTSHVVTLHFPSAALVVKASFGCHPHHTNKSKSLCLGQ